MINMAIARMTTKSHTITVIDVPSDIVERKVYVKNVSGTKIVTIEETTITQWLYAEFIEYVDKIVI